MSKWHRMSKSGTECQSGTEREWHRTWVAQNVSGTKREGHRTWVAQNVSGTKRVVPRKSGAQEVRCRERSRRDKVTCFQDKRQRILHLYRESTAHYIYLLLTSYGLFVLLCDFFHIVDQYSVKIVQIASKISVTRDLQRKCRFGRCLSHLSSLLGIKAETKP